MPEPLVRDKAAQRKDEGAPADSAAQRADFSLADLIGGLRNADRDAHRLVAESIERCRFLQQLGRSDAYPVGSLQKPALEPPVAAVQEALTDDVAVPVHDHGALESLDQQIQVALRPGQVHMDDVVARGDALPDPEIPPGQGGGRNGEISPCLKDLA